MRHVSEPHQRLAKPLVATLQLQPALTCPFFGAHLLAQLGVLFSQHLNLEPHLLKLLSKRVQLAAVRLGCLLRHFPVQRGHLHRRVHVGLLTLARHCARLGVFDMPPQLRDFLLLRLVLGLQLLDDALKAVALRPHLF